MLQFLDLNRVDENDSWRRKSFYLKYSLKTSLFAELHKKQTKFRPAV